MYTQRQKAFLLAAILTLTLLVMACSGPKPSPSPTILPPMTTPTIATTQTPIPTSAMTPATTTPTAMPSPIQTTLATPVPGLTQPSPSTKEISLQWLGQATFILTSSQGTKILIDPTSTSMGYTLGPVSGVDVVTVGHEHADHNNVSLATGTPLILRGLSSTGWNDINQTVKDVSIRTAATYHDSEQGARRGRNSVFVFQLDDLRVVHLSDLGHLLTQEQMVKIGAVDVLLIPVGGYFTIDAQQATQVVQQLLPKIVIPMHYKTPVLRADLPLATVDDFLTGKKSHRPNSNTLSVSRASLPAETTVVVLNYQ